MKRLETRGKPKDLPPGDLVVVLANERAPLDSRWDHPYLVTRLQGPVVTMLNETTGKMRTVNQEKLQLIDPDALWDEERPRVTRAGRKRLLVRGPINQFTPETRTPPVEDEGRDRGGTTNQGINMETPPLSPSPRLTSPPSASASKPTVVPAERFTQQEEGATAWDTGYTHQARKRESGVVTRSQAKRARGPESGLPTLR